MAINLNVLNGVAGWAFGYEYAQAKKKEDEIKQGKNYYLSALLQGNQIAQLANVMNFIAGAHFPDSIRLKTRILCNVVPLLSFPICVFFAAVKEGHYPWLAEKLNQRMPLKVPAQLGHYSTKTFTFLAEHTGNIARVAMLAGSVALIALGSTYAGVGALAALTYETLDTKGFIPRKVSLFMETYMPTVSAIGIVIGGTFPSRVFSALMLTTHLSEKVNRIFQQTVDQKIRKYFKLSGPSLKQIESPLVERRNLSFKEFNEILNARDDQFEPNPVQCARWLNDLNSFPDDKDFKKFLTLFDRIDWKSKYVVVKNKLHDDDRFIDFLTEKFPDAKKEELKNDMAKMEEYIERLATKGKQTKEEFAASWLRAQMVEFVDVLSGKVRVKGSQQDLEEAIIYCGKILPYFNSLDPEKDKITIEDNFLKLGVEGGGYCGRAVKRVATELIGFVMREGHIKGVEELDEAKAYEIRIKQILQEQRIRIIQNVFDQMMRQVGMPEAVRKDVHGFDIYKAALTYGFAPMTHYERRRMSLVDIFLWELYTFIRKPMYDAYRANLDTAVQEHGQVHFGMYMQQSINNNPNLTEAQKEQLLTKLAAYDDAQWSEAEKLHRFQRVMFYMLGVIQKKA